MSRPAAAPPTSCTAASAPADAARWAACLETLAATATQATSSEAAAAAMLDALATVLPAAGLALAVAEVRHAPGDLLRDPFELPAAPGSADDPRRRVVLRYLATTGAASALRGVVVPLADSCCRAPYVAQPGAAATGHERALLPPHALCGVLPLALRGRASGALLVVTAGGDRHDDAPSARRAPAADDRATTAPPCAAALARLAAPLTLAVRALQRLRIEHQEHTRERLLATALAALAHPVLLLDAAGAVQGANDAAASVYGATPAALHGLPFAELVADAPDGAVAQGGAVPHEPARPLRADASNASAAAPLGRRALHRRRDGSTFPAAVLHTPVVDDFGQDAGSVVLVTDLTTEERLEAHLRQQEKLAAVGELVAGVAHELNNPLTGISAFAQLLLEEPLTEDQAESVRLIRRETDRAVAVIRDLLLFARRTGTRLACVDLNELARAAARLRAYHLRSRDITLELALADALPPVSGDLSQLQQVLLHLLANAEDALERVAVRRITLRSWAEAEHVVLEVADTGPGLAPDAARQLFEPFFTTKPAGAGPGLGLSASYGIVGAHGGLLTVDSLPGRGATVRLTLPVATAATASLPSSP